MNKKPANQVKDKTIRLRVTTEFYNELRKYSTDNNISFSKLTRELIKENIPTIQARG